MSTSLLPEDAVVFLNDDSWWIGASERGFGSPLAFDATDSGLFNGNFVPPPPRPPFLEQAAQADGVTTCGMCSWATQNDLLLPNNTIGDPQGDWAFTALMVVVSVISALIGAFLMVTVLKCRRLKATNSTTGRSAVPWWSGGRPTSTPGAAKHAADTIRVPHPTSNSGVWTWLGQRRASGEPDPLSQPSSSPAENHYTHMDDSFNPELMGEALYAELDRESLQSGNPSYQNTNTAYSACGDVDKELQVFSSAPSSAYYSDLSVTTSNNTHPNGERTYEIVGLAGMNQNCCPLLESAQTDPTQFDLNVLSTSASVRRHHRLSAINESSGVSGGASSSQLQPSDFV